MVECEADQCVFVGNDAVCRVYLALFVDYDLLTCKSESVLEMVLIELSVEYAITVDSWFWCTSASRFFRLSPPSYFFLIF